MEIAVKKKMETLIKIGNPHWCLCFLRDNDTKDYRLQQCILNARSVLALEELRRFSYADKNAIKKRIQEIGFIKGKVL